MVIITKKYGQLCNRLFLYGHCIALACEMEDISINLTMKEYNQYFENIKGKNIAIYDNNENKKDMKIIFYIIISCLINVLSKIVNKDKFFRKFIIYKNDNSLKHYKKGDILIINNWNFRQYNYFLKHNIKIREYFRINSDNEKKIEEFFKKINSNKCDNTVTVGVHIRRGDYKTFKNGAYYYSIEEYNNIMKKIEAIFPSQKVRFIIASNEKIDLNEFRGLECYISSGNIIEDLGILSECDYIVGPPSTYSSWASFYGSTPLYTINDIHEGIEINKFSMVTKG